MVSIAIVLAVVALSAALDPEVKMNAVSSYTGDDNVFLLDQGGLAAAIDTRPSCSSRNPPVSVYVGTAEQTVISCSLSQLITSKGYPCEDYTVVTHDHYILGMQRIPHGKHNTTRPRPAVLLQHGLLCSSTNWLTNLETESLAYILADAGFDVWLGNIRGNTYSRKHQTLKPDEKAFWNFSFDQHSLLDLPAMVDLVLNVSQQEQIYYVGHSQGTVMGFAGFSSMPELASKIKLFVALAPVTTVTYIQGLFKFLTDFYKELEVLLDIFGDGEFLPNDDLMKFFAKEVCPTDLDVVCANVLFLICGFDEKNTNDSRMPVYIAHTPAGTSVKNVVHFAQEVQSGKFEKFNYGSSEANMQHYNQSTPPPYDVTKMAIPVALFTGSDDWLADPKDVAGLIPKLPNIACHTNIDYYDHLDFIWGIDAHKVVYQDIIHLFWKYNNNGVSPGGPGQDCSV